jgi:pimeloyl-ACP methyl ester carboxylesterase
MNARLLKLSTALILAAGVSAAQLAARDQMVDVGGRRIHVLVEGEGRPAVIFESGFTQGCKEWEKVQAEIAKAHVTMSYDRAGLGQSDPGRTPRTASQIVRDLHAALRAANVHPPYVLVGHSAGGLYIQMFAHLYPKEIRGLVFLDAVLPSFLDWLKMRDPEAWKDIEEGVVRPASLGVQQQWAAIGESAKQVRAALPLPHVPTIVVASDAPAPPFKHDGGVIQWMRMQEEFARAVPEAKLIVTHGGHEIPEEQPELAITAIDEVIANTH